MAPFYGCVSTVYLLLLSFQKFLVLILSTSEEWRAESTLEPLSGFEHRAPALGIQRLNLQAIAQNKKRHSYNVYERYFAFIANFQLLFPHREDLLWWVKACSKLNT